MNEERERIYLSNQREPLGKGFSRNHAFPEHVQDEKFRFGIKSDTDVGAKGLIYAHSGHTETQREIMQRTKNSNKVDLRARYENKKKKCGWLIYNVCVCVFIYASCAHVIAASVCVCV